MTAPVVRLGVASWLASLGGVGRLPASGTAASAVTVAAVILVPPVPLASQVAVIAAVTVLGWWAAQVCVAADPSDPDPHLVVIDEVAGMLIACVALPRTPWHFAGAFLAFRFWDIVKSFPMKQLERLPGGWGIMADDLAAGLLARLCLLPWT